MRVDDKVPRAISRREAMFAAAAIGLLPAVARASAPAGWREVGFPFLRGNEFSQADQGAIMVDGARASSLLYRPIAIDLMHTPRLNWRWRVDSGPPATDLSVRGRDDRALAVIIGFPFDPATASTAARAQHRAMRLLLGRDAPGRSLHYVWGSGQPRGSIIRPAKTDSHRFIVLRPASEATGVWRSESVDVAADYRRAFGEAPPRAVQLAIASDGDDTRSTVRALVGGFAWS